MKAILFYQKNSPPHTRGKCRYTPTCSQYALQAIERFGALRGTFMAIGRFLRCNPLFKPGYDPVPQRKH